FSAGGSTTQLSGQATLAAGSFSVTVKNNSTGLTSAAVSVTVSSRAPVISGITTDPSTPVQGESFTVTLNGSEFDASNNTVYFSGPGCAPSCTATASGSTTRVSGQATLGAGAFTVTIKNNITGLTSGGVSLTVSSATPAISS